MHRDKCSEKINETSQFVAVFESMSVILGQGSYGKVTVRNGHAIKKFSKLAHLIQEYLALSYLRDCPHVVNLVDVSFERLELTMDLYDCSLRDWITESRMRLPRENIMIILRDILLGLSELQDRNLAHGDLKPGNILIRRTPLRAVLGDCGFVSIAKYAKVERTAPTYRDPVVAHDTSHDMYSLGICLLEMIGGIKMIRQAEFDQLYPLLKSNISSPQDRKLIQSLIQPYKLQRPTARELLSNLFRFNPPRWEPRHVGTSSLPALSFQDTNILREYMKTIQVAFDINRARKGYGALLLYLDEQEIPRIQYELCALTTLVILSSVFGKPGFTEDVAVKFVQRKYTVAMIMRIMDKLLRNVNFCSRLLSP